MTKLKSLFAAGTVIAIAATTTVSFAGSHADPAISGAIKARQSHMQLYMHNAGILGAMAQGKMDYDASAASAAASNLAALSQLNQRSYWPQGSDNASAENTRALPAIWENFPDVGAKAQAFTDAALAAEAAAGESLEALQASMGPVFQACGACHSAYRQSNN